MTRSALEHIIRAAGTIANVKDIVVVGSQAILGQFPDAPAELLVSNEADIFPRGCPSRSDLIDATIGEGSPFQASFGYYAHGVDESTSVLPEGWRERLILIKAETAALVSGWCLEVHDLAISKYVAGRDKDRDFTRALVRHRMVSRGVLLDRLASTSLPAEIRALVAQRIEADFAAA